jgi:hypothetical protein
MIAIAEVRMVQLDPRTTSARNNCRGCRRNFSVEELGEEHKTMVLAVKLRVRKDALGNRHLAPRVLHPKMY